MSIKRTIVTTLPTTLAEGKEVYYRDPNGVQTLWVGNAQGEAWPSVGYKEYVALLTQAGTDAPVATVLSNTIGEIVWTRIITGYYNATSSGLFTPNKTAIVVAQIPLFSESIGILKYAIEIVDENIISLASVEDQNYIDDALAGLGPFIIRVSP